ncbi:hypothetical protein BC940DRAFT_305013 [Gongronella butleri]|nr:hypothetical protein BC940DRAFT_305013 [Gongronella butleri]
MMFTHTLADCPLNSLPSVMITATDRRVVGWSKTMPALIAKHDLAGIHWPSKKEQSLCFTTLVDVACKKQKKRLLTCEHASMHDAQCITVFCADVAMLEKATLRQMLASNAAQTTILRLNPYGVIQAAFDPQEHRPWMVGQPLMRFVHDDDIPTLCQALRQATTREPEDQVTLVSFDVRCHFTSSQGFESTSTSNSATSSDTDDELDDLDPEIDENDELDDMDDDDASHDTDSTASRPSRRSSLAISDTSLQGTHTHMDKMYHFSTIVTSSQDILCVIRPQQPSAQQSNGTRAGMPSTQSHGASSQTLLQATGLKIKQLVDMWQQTLWQALEQGLMLLAHYIALVMVFTLQSYRLATHSSFWLETSELALRCVVAETKSRPELDRLFGWIECTGFKSSRKWFTLALDHGSEWIITMLLRPKSAMPL